MQGAVGMQTTGFQLESVVGGEGVGLQAVLTVTGPIGVTLLGETAPGERPVDGLALIPRTVQVQL